MGQLALGVAGAVVGSFFGAPGLGFAIGAGIGGAVFNKSGNVVREGARLGDQTITASTYGNPIPICYGAPGWLHGNVLWQKGIREVRTEETEGGKGGTPKTTTVTYTYFNSFAVGFAEGEAAGLMRIKIDEKLVFDVTNKIDQLRALTETEAKKELITDVLGIEQKKSGIEFRFYNGSEDQLPDPLIVADKGDLAPAHRGMVYIMFDDLPLANYGNRAIPQIQIDIAFKNEPVPIFAQDFSTYTFHASTPQNMLGQSVTKDGRYLFLFAATQTTTRVLRKIDLSDMSVVFAINTGIMGSGFLVLGFGQMMDIDDEGNVYITTLTPTVGTWRIYKYSGTDGSLLGFHDSFEFRYTSSPATYLRATVGSYPMVNGSHLYKNVVLTHVEPMVASNRTTAVFDGNNLAGSVGNSSVGVLGAVTFLLNAIAPNNESNNPIAIVQARNPVDAFGNLQGYMQFKVITFGFDSTGSNNQWLNLYWLNVRMHDFFTERFHVNTISLNFLKDDGHYFSDSATITAFSNGSGFVLNDPETNDAIFSLRSNAAGGSPTYLLRFTNSGILKWYKKIDEGNTNTVGMFQNRLGGIKPYKHGVSASFLPLLLSRNVGILNIETGDIEEDVEDWSGGPNSANAIFNNSVQQYYLKETGCIIYQQSSTNSWNLLYKGCLTYTGEIDIDQISDNLANIVRNISNRVGHENSDVDVSELVPIPVPGFRISQGQARTPIEQLMSIYQFDIVESDYVLKAVLRGQSPVLNIPEDDLIIIEESTGEIVRERRIQEVELPEEVTIGYIEWEQEYVPGLQRAKRILNPVPTMYSRNKLSLEVPIMEEGTFMKRVAEKILYSTWLGRSIYEFTSSWKYLRLDPTDVVTITLDSGTVFQARLTNNSIDGNLALSFEAVSDEAASYISSSTEADVGSGAIGQLIVSVPPSYAFLFNVPLLRDVDDNGRLFMRQYFALAPKTVVSTSIWSGAMLLKSSDNVLYGQVAQSNSPVTWGLTMDALPSVKYWNQTDTVNTLTVKMESGGGELSSVSQLQMLNGSNPALLISDDGGVEVIQFRDVEVLDDGIYRFSNLLRGRRGTESFMTGHHVGEKFIFLSPSTVSYISSGLSERNVNRFYRAVSFGTLLEDADVYQFQHKGRDLMPWAPVYVGADMGYDSVLLTWIRRARINNEANFIIESGLGLPLAEDDESYEVDILDGPSGNVLRTIATIGNPSIVYLDSQIITDFGSVPPEINVSVYQMSGQVGRGFTIEQVAQTGSYINLEAESTTLFNELPGSPSDFHKEIMNILISDLKAAGVWTKMRLLYVFATYNQQASLLNWKAPATVADILVPNGSPDFSIEEGWQAQADGDRLNLATAWNAIGTYVQNSAHLGTFNLTDSLTNGAEVGRGYNTSGTSNPILRSRKGDGNFGVLINGAEVLAAVPNSLGHFVGNRSGSTAVQLYKDGVSVGTGSTSSSSVSNLTVQFLSSQLHTGYSNRRVSMVHAGNSLTAAEVALINTAFKRYMKFIT